LLTLTLTFDIESYLGRPTIVGGGGSPVLWLFLAIRPTVV